MLALPSSQPNAYTLRPCNIEDHQKQNEHIPHLHDFHTETLVRIILPNHSKSIIPKEEDDAMEEKKMRNYTFM